MSKGVGLALALCLVPSLASAAVPDTDAILRVAGRYGLAHACPISDEMAVTNAHVVDLRPYDLEYPLTPALYSDAFGNAGLLDPTYVLIDRDLAVTSGHFQRWYPRAPKAPEAGETVWFIGYRFDGKHALETKTIKAVVQRVVAAHVVYAPGGMPGSSGSCVLNEKGEIVAVNAFTVHEGESGIGVGLWVGVWEPKK